MRKGEGEDEEKGITEGRKKRRRRRISCRFPPTPHMFERMYVSVCVPAFRVSAGRSVASFPSRSLARRRSRLTQNMLPVGLDGGRGEGEGEHAQLHYQSMTSDNMWALISYLTLIISKKHQRIRRSGDTSRTLALE